MSKGNRADMEVVEAAHIAWRPLGRLLVEQGLLTNDELERALAQQQTTDRRLGETIVELGFVSGPDLASALATQYGIELTTETGFGTGLRAEIQRRHENERGMTAVPALNIVETPPSEPEDSSRAVELDQANADGADEALLLMQLEEQWARLAAAEAALYEDEKEITALRRERDRKRMQATRLIRRVRERDRRLEEPSEELGHLAGVAEAQLEEIERLTGEANERMAEIEQLTRTARDRDAKIEQLDADVNRRNAEIEQFKNEVKNRDTEIERMTREVRDRKAEVERLTNDVQGRSTEIEQLTSDANAREAEIERLTSSAGERDAALERLTSEVNGRSAEIECLTADVKGCDVEIERLRHENERLRAQAGRFATRLRREPLQPDEDPEPASHLVFVQLDDGYELVESDGPPPPLHAVFELPQFSEDDFVVTRLGRSPLPADARSCIFVQRV